MKKLFLIDIFIYLLDYVFTGETTEDSSAEGATTQESLRQIYRWVKRVNMEIKKTSLYQLHQDSKAKFVEFAGYQMPIQYSDGIVEEH